MERVGRGGKKTQPVLASLSVTGRDTNSSDQRKCNKALTVLVTFSGGRAAKKVIAITIIKQYLFFEKFGCKENKNGSLR